MHWVAVPRMQAILAIVRALRRSNALARRRQNGAVPDYVAGIDRTRDVFTRRFWAAGRLGRSRPAPIFVLGLLGRVRRWSNRFWRAMATLKGQWNCPSFQRLPDKSRKQEALPRSIA
jgi:hypothetical protein